MCGHIGYPWTEEMIAVARKHENVHIDTSAYTSRRLPPELVAYMKTARRRHKVLFGSNYPMIPRHALEDLDALELDAEARDAVPGGQRAPGVRARRRLIAVRTLRADRPGRAGAPGGVFANLDLVAPPTPELHERFRQAIGRPEDDPTDRLTGLCEQLAWLREAGFEPVDCRFKWLELTLLVAVRPPGEKSAALPP